MGCEPNTWRGAEAEPAYERALVIVKSTLGPEQPDVAENLENEAVLLRDTERNEEAAEMETRADAIRVKHDGENP